MKHVIGISSMYTLGANKYIHTAITRRVRGLALVRDAIAFLMIVAMAVAIPRIGIAAAIAPVTDNGQTQSPGIRALVEHLQSRYQETSTLTAKFTQTVTHAGGMTQTRTGTIALRKPGQMRWEFTGDQPETIVSNGKTVFDYDPGLNQVVESPIKQAFRTSAAAAFLLGVGSVERDFNAAAPASSPSDGLQHVMLTPRDGGDRVDVGVNPRTFDIETLKIEDALGNTTALRFTDIRANNPLDQSLFTFQVPQGADIVGSDGAH